MELTTTSHSYRENGEFLVFPSVVILSFMVELHLETCFVFLPHETCSNQATIHFPQISYLHQASNGQEVSFQISCMRMRDSDVISRASILRCSPAGTFSAVSQDLVQRIRDQRTEDRLSLEITGLLQFVYHTSSLLAKSWDERILTVATCLGTSSHNYRMVMLPRHLLIPVSSVSLRRSYTIEIKQEMV